MLEARASSVGMMRKVPLIDGNGNLTFEAGPHQGFHGDPTAIQGFCAALS
jgi:hypothetical protein